MPTNIYDMADTWNNVATTFTAIKMNVTDTTSASASLLLDLQVGGASRFNVTKAGLVTFPSGGSSSSVSASAAPNGNFGVGISLGVGSDLSFIREKNATGNITMTAAFLELGANAWTTTPGTGNISAPWAAGTNISGSNMNVYGGLATGTGTPGAIVFQTTTTTGSGATRQTYSERARINTSGVFNVASAVATPAAGSAAASMLFGTTASFGIYYGSGAPTVSAAQGSLYIRSDGSGTANRLYVNTDGATTWTNFVSAA